MSYQSTVLADASLVAYWQLDETSGFIAHDSKGTRDGFLNFGPVLNRVGPSSFIPRACFFNGTSSFIEVPTDPVFHPGAPGIPATFTLEAWLQYGVYDVNLEPWLAGVAYSDGFYRFAYGGGLQESARSFDQIGWHYLAETHDGTTRKWYKDGVLVGSTPESGFTDYPDFNPFVMGGWGSDSGGALNGTYAPNFQFLNGYLAQVAFYNTALSPSRIAAHYFAGYNDTGGGSTFTKAGSSQVIFTPTSDGNATRHQASVTQVVAEVVRGQIDGLAYVTQVVIETVRPYVAGSAHTFDVVASASIVFTATVAGHPAHPAAATAEIIFTPVSNAFHGLYKVASATIVFTATAVLDNVKIGHSASVTIIFKPRAKNLFLPIVFGDDYLGRFQLGSEVPLWDLVRDQHGQPALPTVQPPEARIYNLDLRQHVETVDLVRLRGSRNDSIYTRALRLGALYQTGRHAVMYRAPSGGFVGYNLAIFEVVDGGDISGPVIASHTFPAPGGDQVMAHLASGALAKGARPRVS